MGIMKKNIEKINKELRAQAVKCGLCAQWQGEWDRAMSADTLMQMYVRGIDFCIANDWPTTKYMANNFDKEVLHRNGVWVDSDVRGHENLKTIVLNGCCTGELIFSGYDVATVYVRHGSRVRIMVTDWAIVFVRVYDRAEVEVVNQSYRRQSVYTYSDDCTVSYGGDVKIKERDFAKIYKN